MNKFAGRVIGIEIKSGDENQSEDVIIELTEVEHDGSVELRMRDRNEDFYVKFRLHDLVEAAVRFGKTSS